MREVTPDQVVSNPSWVLLDIRPLEERMGDLGFVPGSRSVPMVTWDVEAVAAALPFVQRPENIVLFCATGRRSGRIAEEAATSDLPISHLGGGVLGWSGGGLPTASSAREDLLDDDDLAISDTGGLRRLLLACFVAEATELAFEGGDLPPASAIALLDSCFEAAGVSPDEREPEPYYAVIDAASSLFRSSGGSLERIAANVSRMCTILGRLKR